MPSQMRIAHVVHSFDTGGLEKGVATLVRRGSPRIEHIVICLSHAGASTSLLPDGVQVLELGKSRGHSFAFLQRLGRVLRQLRPDVVHTRNWGGLDGVVACRLVGIRAVVHGEHGWDMTDPHGLSRRRLLFRRITSRWMAEITCVSRQMAEWLSEAVRVKKAISQIYNGVDAELYRPGDPDARGAVRRDLGLPAESLLLVTCGRLDPIKGHSSLLHAFAAVREDQPDARLLVIGDGIERARLESLAGPGVQLLGHRRDVATLLAASDLFVLPSLNEGISNTILEAMASGLPVVATRVGGNPELVVDGATGTLVAPKAEQGLAAAMRLYLRQPALRATHGRAGRARVLERFSIGQMVEAYERVYERVAGPAAH